MTSCRAALNVEVVSSRDMRGPKTGNMMLTWSPGIPGKGSVYGVFGRMVRLLRGEV